MSKGWQMDWDRGIGFQQFSQLLELVVADGVERSAFLCSYHSRGQRKNAIVSPRW